MKGKLAVTQMSVKIHQLELVWKIRFDDNDDELSEKVGFFSDGIHVFQLVYKQMCARWIYFYFFQNARTDSWIKQFLNDWNNFRRKYFCTIYTVNTWKIKEKQIWCFVEASANEFTRVVLVLFCFCYFCFVFICFCLSYSRDFFKHCLLSPH